MPYFRAQKTPFYGILAVIANQCSKQYYIHASTECSILFSLLLLLFSGPITFTFTDELRSVPICRKYAFNLVARRINVKWSVRINMYVCACVCVWHDFNTAFYIIFIRSNLHANCVRHKDLGLDGLKKNKELKWRTTTCGWIFVYNDYNLTGIF